jgi:hypothetical protein
MSFMQSPYASKKIGDQPLFARNHGIQQDLVAGANTIEFNAIYPLAKVTGVEVIGAENLDYANFKVFFGATMLNQFAFNVNIGKDFYQRISRFDADFVQGLKIVIEYNSVSAKRIGVNFIMDEVKT